MFKQDSTIHKNHSFILHNTLAQNLTQESAIIPAVYVFFSVLAIVDNCMIYLLFLSHRSLLTQASNRFILLIAIVDGLTGVMVIISPASRIFGDFYPYPHGPILGPLFCAVIGSEYFIWVFGFISIYTMAVLSLERLYTVLQPASYKKIFTHRNVNIMIAGLIIIGLVISMANLFQSQYRPNSVQPCQWLPLTTNQGINAILNAVLFILKFLFPATIVCTCYTIIACKIQNMKHTNGDAMIHAFKLPHRLPSQRHRRAKKQVTIMIFAASIALIICWLPNQIYFLLVQLTILPIRSSVHVLTKALVIANSCINPFIYVMLNNNYRKLLMQTTFKLCHNHSRILRPKRIHTK